MVLDFLLDLGATVAIGALVGIERERRRDRTTVYAGARTFPLISTLGFLAALIGERGGSIVPLAAGLAVIGLGAIAFFYVRANAGEIGFTTPMAFIVTFLAGALIGSGLLLEGVVVAVVTTALLLTKQRLHRFAETMSEDEMMGALQFIALAFIALPLARAADGPYLKGLVGADRPIDPAWMLYVVVAVSALSLVSFLALRKLGSAKGLPTAGAFGGLVNSQAATVSAGALAKETRGLEMAASSAVLAAASTAFARTMVIVVIVDPSLKFAWRFGGILILPALITGGVAYWRARRAKAGQAPTVGELGLRSPFAIKPALLFALVFGAVNAGAFFLQAVAGPWGVYATSIGAFISAGAVIASAATLAGNGSIPMYVGLITAALALVVSLVSRLFALLIVNRALIGHVALPMILAGVAIVAGVLVLV